MLLTSLLSVEDISEVERLGKFVSLRSWFFVFDSLVITIAGMSTATTIRHATSVMIVSLLEVSIVVVDILGNIECG